MNLILKLEELAMLLLGLFLFTYIDFPWWLFAVLFFAPDIGLLGYLFGNRAGAVIYNLFHHKGIAIVCYISGVLLDLPLLQLTGLVLFSHASFDRIVGYGLKYERGFKFTHLGQIGKDHGER